MPTQTQVSGPSAEFMPYYNSLLNAGFNYANKPLQQYTGPMVAGMSDIQHQALSGIQNQMGGNPMMQQAQGLLGGLMQGGGNPFMGQMVGDVTNQARRAYEEATGAINNRFTNPNSFGNSRHAMMQDQANEAFARGLGGALGQLQYNAYGEGLDRQMRAAQLGQGLQQQQFSQLLQGLQAGSVPRNIRQQQMDANYNQFREARDYPWQAMGNLNNILSGVRSQQQVTQTPDPSRASQALGYGSLLASLFGGSGGLFF